MQQSSVVGGDSCGGRVAQPPGLLSYTNLLLTPANRKPEMPADALLGWPPRPTAVTQNGRKLGIAERSGNSTHLQEIMHSLRFRQPRKPTPSSLRTSWEYSTVALAARDSHTTWNTCSRLKLLARPKEGRLEETLCLLVEGVWPKALHGSGELRSEGNYPSALQTPRGVASGDTRASCLRAACARRVLVESAEACLHGHSPASRMRARQVRAYLPAFFAGAGAGASRYFSGGSSAMAAPSLRGSEAP